MAITRPVIERQESWRRGEVKAVESQKISLDSLIRSENFERDLDGSLVSSPGFDTEFVVGLHRQIADMEDGENARWSGGQLDLVNFQYGFQSRKHAHGGAGSINSTFTRPLAFLGNVFNTTTDQINFNFRASDVSELVNVEIRFREAGGDYFTTTITPSGWVDGVFELEQVLQSAFTVSGTPEWDQIVDMHIISTSAVVDAGGVVDLTFDDFFILRPGDTTGEPIWEVFGFERVSTPERFLMVASGSEIWSYLGTVKTKRLTSQNANRPVNMIVANDMTIAANGSDPIKRWDAGDSTFRDLGVPIPPDTIVGTEAGVAGLVAAGTYFFVTVFDMGTHGEGNSVSPAGSSLEILTGPDRIDYSVIPIGPPGTIRRLIYRTVAGAGASGSLRLDVIVPGNIATAAQSNVSDANLGATLVQDGNQPLIGSMLVHANRTLFLAGVPGSESSVFFSDTTRAPNRTIEQWRATNEFRLNPDDGDRITGMIYFNRFIYVFKRRSTWILNPITLGNPIQISTTFGSVGHRCLVDGGTVLYAWSDEHGPLEIRGQSIIPIGILETNLEREGPRVGDINGDVPATGATILGSLITTQTEFKTGTFNDTNADEIAGSVLLARTALPGTSQSTDLAPQAGGSASSTIALDGSADTLNAINANLARDGDDTTEAVWRVENDLSSPTLDGLTMTGILLITLQSPQNVSRIRIVAAGINFGNGVDALFTVQYKPVGSTSFVTAGVFSQGVAPTVTPPTQDFFFGPVDAQEFRVLISFGPFISGSRDHFAFISTFSVFESGYTPAGEWISGPLDLGQVPSAWGRFNANFSSRPTGDIQFFMRSAATSGELGASSIIAFQPLTVGIRPDELVIPLNRFIEWKAVFTSSDPTETPKLDDISILFTSAASNFIRPRFESVGVLFDRRYWLSAVLREDSNPTLVWKYQQLLKSWSRHPGFNTSSWTNLSEDFFSGSAVDGQVLRNVMDANGELITSHSGNKILCIAETKDSPFTGQDHTNTVMDFAVVCRNEDRERKNLIRNPSFENWPTNFSPAAWDSTGNIRDGQRLIMETDPRNISDGSFSLRLDWSNPSTSVLVSNNFFRIIIPNTADLLAFQDISLKPDQDYILTFEAKKDIRASMNIFRIQDFRSDGNHEFLRNDGTWGPLVDEFLGDNTTVSETMTKRKLAFISNSPDSNHVFYRVQFGYLASTTGTPGTTWIDDVTLFEAPESIPRFLNVLPILDGKDDVPERRINLTGIDDGILDVGVVRKQFRIDRALVRNGRFRIRYEESSGRAKVLGLYTKSVAEEWRQ